MRELHLWGLTLARQLDGVGPDKTLVEAPAAALDMAD